MHSIYLVVKEFRGCFKGKFWFYCTFVLLRGHIFASIEKFGSRVWNVQINHLWLTQIYFYRWYIPDLIRLANDIETNPGPVVVDNIDSNKTICAPYSQPSAVFNNYYEQNLRKFTRNHKANKKPAVFTSLRELITAKYCFPQTSQEIPVQEWLIQRKLLLHHTIKVMLRF